MPQKIDAPAKRLRELVPSDRAWLARVLKECDAFIPAEQAVALELIDIILKTPDTPDYQALVAVGEKGPAAYILWGANPVADRVYEVYWIATDPKAERNGWGRMLLNRVEEIERSKGMRLCAVETAGKPSYARARAFYLACDYTEEARVKDFYAPGDDKVIYTKRL